MLSVYLIFTLSLLALFLAFCVYLWRSREILMRDLHRCDADASALRERVKFLEEAVHEKQTTRDQIAETFKSLAASALEASMGQFFSLAKNSFDQAQEVHKLDSDHRIKSMDALVKPMVEALENYKKQIEMLEKERQRAFLQIDGELKKVAEGQVSLARETTALKDALKKPHVRGRWGELQLKNCIELSGMSEYADVSFQNLTSDDDGSRHIPDMLVRMPGGRRIIVDAKTPIDAFLSALEASSEETRQLEMARHGRHVKEHVRRLSSRAYTEVVKDTADFTVLFLPNESFLYAALESEPDIVEFALQKRVLIATPPTLVGLLKVIRFGWSEQRMAENAQKISEMGQELHKRLCDFVDTYESVGRHLDKAKEEYEKGRSRLESRVLVQGRRFEALGAKSAKTLVGGADSEPSG